MYQNVHLDYSQESRSIMELKTNLSDIELALKQKSH